MTCDSHMRRALQVAPQASVCAWSHDCDIKVRHKPWHFQGDQGMHQHATTAFSRQPEDKIKINMQALHARELGGHIQGGWLRCSRISKKAQFSETLQQLSLLTNQQELNPQVHALIAEPNPSHSFIESRETAHILLFWFPLGWN